MWLHIFRCNCTFDGYMSRQISSFLWRCETRIGPIRSLVGVHVLIGKNEHKYKITKWTGNETVPCGTDTGNNHPQNPTQNRLPKYGSQSETNHIRPNIEIDKLDIQHRMPTQLTSWPTLKQRKHKRTMARTWHPPVFVPEWWWFLAGRSMKKPGGCTDSDNISWGSHVSLKQRMS